MIRRTTLFTLLLAAGCAVGPGYHPSPVVAPSSQVGAASYSDTAKAFYDSLAGARAQDSTPAYGALPLAPRRVRADSIADLAWLDILQDSTLNALVQIALRQNRDLATAKARVQEFRADVGLARAPLFPSLTGNGSASKNQVAFGPQVFQYNAIRVTADVAWELDFWGKTRRGMQAANADLAAQDAVEQETVLSLVSSVAIGYLQLLELDQEAQVSAHTLQTSQATLDLARQRYARGIISELDVRQFEAQVAAPAVRLAQVEQIRAQTEHALNVLLGQGPTVIPRHGALSEAARAVTVPDSLPSTLLARRPDVRQAERAYRAANARAGQAFAQQLPIIMFTGSYGSQAATSNGLFKPQSDIYVAQLGISIPLFAGGARSSTTAAANARAEQARNQYEQTVLRALQDAGDALSGARAARDQVAAAETQAIALRRAYDLAQVRYRSGIANYLEVLDAERSLFTAELTLSQAELGQLTAAVQLYKALGGSWSGTTETK
ncbi:MAG TPA: efflux transporter outer membrane subunit [Gemmatimonadales bacterium]|jgi:multidrug efflux system outer membrane protein|nr:efflux transporter outer membrane subunit [Gemmatimonadales bacterium]